MKTKKKMLIDTSCPEETRVAIINNGELEELEFESLHKQQLKGNIYLAKVVRVEPSLQAAFVDYGQKRHGFLAFSEIHPSYYRIPMSDREEPQKQESPLVQAEDPYLSEPQEGGLILEEEWEEELTTDDVAAGNIEELGDALDTTVEEIGGEDYDVAVTTPKPTTRDETYKYKIQEVIHKNQIMLIQVGKEERNAKGAALTTYVSLAGRYCVLMPNSEREGGISRKINEPTARKKLKSFLETLPIPEGMGVIIRTAGTDRTRLEIRRDFDYLVRLWNDIRDLTLTSIAPCLIYEEGSLVKRAIRDLYSRDIEELLVQGEEGYKTAKDFIKTLIPSHSKKVKLYKEPVPLFCHYKVDEQLDTVFNPLVRLPSGGYLIIHQTEALVSIDVNSGRATRERHIEETALKTNLEAAEEAARQLRLRNLSGLIVIDFIDMESAKHIISVEKRLKESMQSDRARIQIGRISPFGLLELSRQRLHPSLIETMTTQCQHCTGTGFSYTPSTLALQALRVAKRLTMDRPGENLMLRIGSKAAHYLLNEKRHLLTEFEKEHTIKITVYADDMIGFPGYSFDSPLMVVTKKSAETNTSTRRSKAKSYDHKGKKEKPGAHKDKHGEYKAPEKEKPLPVAKEEVGEVRKQEERPRRPNKRRNRKKPITDLKANSISPQKTPVEGQQPSPAQKPMHRNRKRHHGRRPKEREKGNEKESSREHPPFLHVHNGEEGKNQNTRQEGKNVANFDTLHEAKDKRKGWWQRLLE